jgi:general secretion pathway protein D
VTPSATAAKSTGAPEVGGGALPPGYNVRVVPLRYISATEMQKILEPFANPTNLVRIDVHRNLLILAGSSKELRGFLDTVEIFDVDWLKGMSVGLFTPDFVDAETLAGDLESIFGDDAQGPLAGLVRFVVIERLDALLVISPRPEYLEKARGWIDRLDHDTGTVGQRLFVYHVQNGKAADLAAVLSEVFRSDAAGVAPPPLRLAPGTEAAGVESEPPPVRSAPVREGAAAQPAETPPPVVSLSQTGGTSGEGVAIGESESIRIIADEVNNAILILATAQEYRQVEAAIRQLDIVPLQVLIEATIAEVTLTGELSLGLEWFFKNNVSSTKSGRGTLDLGAAGLSALVPGFSYAIVGADQIRLVLNTLASESKLNIISSPSLMVLNNQQASIEVGDQVPVTTQQQQATSGVADIVSSIEYRDTGVLLTVTPRVNAGGLVIMEIEQEVSNVDQQSAAGDGSSSQSLTPTIQQRKISSTVAIQSGETVVLGGLIRETKDDDETGIPGLHTIPVLGYLFGAKSKKANRTELVVLITPRALQGAREARDVTNEFRRKMESLKPLVPAPVTLPEAADGEPTSPAAVDAAQAVAPVAVPEPASLSFADNLTSPSDLRAVPVAAPVADPAVE